MIDLVRSEYGYSDEYILGKRFFWLINCCELIERRKYNDHVTSATLIAAAVSKMMGEKSEPLKSYDEIMAEENGESTSMPGNHDENFMSDKVAF